MKYALILISIFLVGCTTVKPKQACIENPQTLAVGMSHDQVRDLYGNPRYVRSGLLKGGEETEMWAYLNRGCPRDQTMVFFNDNGRVDHWQTYVLRDHNQIFFLTQMTAQLTERK